MQELEGREILVTGGAGFIGSHLCQKLLEYNVRLTVYDNLSTGSIENIKGLQERIRFVRGDIRSTEFSEKAGSPDLIFHLAAQTSVPKSMANPVEDYEINAYGTLNVLELARKKDSRVVYTSSAAIYGNPEVLPTPEDCPPKPVSFYGLSKLVGEEYCKMYMDSYGLEVSIARISNAYGSRGHGVIKDFIDKIRLNKRKLEVLGTGEQSRDFIHVSDVVNALVLSATMNEARGQIFNVGSGESMKIIELAKLMIRMLGLENVTLISTTNRSWKGDIEIIWLDISKAKKVLNWKPSVRFENGLKSLMKGCGLPVV